MRIALIGNMGNNAYRMCKWMRAMGIDAHIYMVASNNNDRSLPESVDRELKDNYPDWIKRYQQLDQGLKVIKPPQAFEMEEAYDVILTSGPGGLRAAAHFDRVPMVHMSLGGEVNTMPFWLFERGKPRRHRIAAIQVRRGLRKVMRVVTGYHPDYQSLFRLGHGEKILTWGYPEDVVGNMARVDQPLLAELTKKYEPYDRVLMWLSRVNYLRPGIADYKGVHHFADAAARLVGEGGETLRLLVGRHGQDVGAFEERLRSLGIEEHVEWVPHLPYWELLTYLSVPNAIVLDELCPAAGELSGMAREALSVGAVILKTIDVPLLTASFGSADFPMPSAHDADTCHDELERLISMPPAVFRELGEAGRTWALARLHYEHQVPRMMEFLRQAWYLHHLRTTPAPASS